MGLLVVLAGALGGVADLRSATAAAATSPAAAGTRLAAVGAATPSGRITVAPTAIRSIAPAAQAAAVPPDVAQRQAREILDQKRFRHKTPPRPLRGVLRWIGDRLRPITQPIGRAFGALAQNTALAWFAGLVVVAIVVAATVALLARRERARVASSAGGSSGGQYASESFDPAELERAAATAEAEGRFEDAVRLRFRAGLARLALTGRLPAGLVEPNGEIARDLASPHFDLLSQRFDEIVYGDRSAVATDVADARREWPAVLQEVRR